MKIVLDTNVLVSGLLSPFKSPGEIVRMASAGLLQLCYDARILSEYTSVLTRVEFGFEAGRIHDLLDQIKGYGYSVVGEPLEKALPDRTDEPFLEVAIAGGASCLVTGNLKHFPRVKEGQVWILSPNDFLIFYRNSLK